MRVKSPPERLAVAKPLYCQVRDILLARVRSGEWAAGEALPNEFLLAQQCGVSIGTIRRAIEELGENGVVVRKQGRGTFVSGPGPSALADRFNRLRIAGDKPSRLTLLGLERRAALPEEATTLGLGAAGADVYEVVQSMTADGIGIGVEHSVVPAAIFPRFETQMTFGQHVYPVLAHYGVLITRIAETVGIVSADEAGTELAGARGTPLLSIVRTALSLDRGPVEMRRSFYRSDVVRYVAPES